jgi:Cu2+-containing amine oxidase
MEWIFRDDGILIGRVGATAVNLPSKPLMTHVHNPIWRLDIDLDGFPGDSAKWMAHAESGLLGVDSSTLSTQEGGFKWNAEQFNVLEISDANLKNSKGHASSYMLMPMPSGMSRHQEAFTANDFWVTRYNGSEMNAKDVVAYASNSQPTAGQDLVVWYKGSLHHFPRDEDGEFSGGYWKGEAHVMWTGFMMMPHNLFDRTPFVP